ncbi:MAG TPA: ATPase, T2SS/T4P/T4SS family [Polyangia bacterium]|jgi:pilus assembly protein CpaF
MQVRAEPRRIEILVDGPSGRVRLPFSRELVLVGRDRLCDVRLEDRTVSRRHAALRLGDEGVFAEDLSTNGTFVGGERLDGEVAVPFGAALAMGVFSVRVIEHEGEPTPVPVAVEREATIPFVTHKLESLPAVEERPAETVVPDPEPSPFAVSSDLAETSRWLRDTLLDSLDLRRLTPKELEGPELRLRVETTLDRLVDDHARRISPSLPRPRLRKLILDEVLGLGPLEDFLKDATVAEVMVIDRDTIYIERRGRIELTGARFTSDDALRSAIERIVTPLGRRIDESTPMVDARLKDGSRVNAIIPPLALKGPCVTIRKFPASRLRMDDLLSFGSLDERMARFLERSVVARKNLVVSGGTGSGKTTLLNVLSSAIPRVERIITIEDAAELTLGQPHVVTLETRPRNMEGKGEYTIRDLVRNALRMRPDRIIVGECRGGEALDMLQAMNTGHDGSLTTIHANSAAEAVARMETLVLMAGLELPARAIREQIAASIHVIVQQARFSDGSRRITDVSEVIGIQDDGSIRTEPIFEFVRAPNQADGGVVGEYRATGYMPSYVEDFVTLGLVRDGKFL